MEFNCNYTPKGQWVKAWSLFPAFHAAPWPQGGTYKHNTGTSRHSPMWANSRSQTTLGSYEAKVGTANRSPLAHQFQSSGNYCSKCYIVRSLEGVSRFSRKEYGDQ